MAGATAGGIGADHGADWWTGVPVPRAPQPSDLLRPGSAVPVAGPAARDADGDGLPETLLAVDGAGGMSLWTDLDGDGLADRVTLLGGPVAGPWPDDPERPGLVGGLLRCLVEP